MIVFRYHMNNTYMDWHEIRIHSNSNPIAACLAAVAAADQQEVKHFTGAALGGPSPWDAHDADVNANHPGKSALDSIRRKC